MTTGLMAQSSPPSSCARVVDCTVENVSKRGVDMSRHSRTFWEYVKDESAVESIHPVKLHTVFQRMVGYDYPYPRAIFPPCQWNAPVVTYWIWWA